MITLTIPDWLIWLIIAAFFLQWGLNAAIAYYKNRCAEAWGQLDEVTKRALGGKTMPHHAKF